jgi:acyl-CoA synthetase (AMP-forming)/AMP-acid ligase II
MASPQCSSSAVSHLASSSASSYLIYHPKYADLARSVHPLSSYIPLVELPPLPALSISSPLPAAAEISLPHPHSISHIFHTSGTSGNPKPIPHTHYQSVTSLPRRALPSYLSHYASGAGMAPGGAAAFTTTPLFHGGISDLLRAWMARSMIYFYPTSDTAITVANVVKAVEQCNGPLPPPPLLPKVGMGEMTEDQLAERTTRFTVIAFLSVPYILTILAEEENGPGIELLKGMELVSTGGAPLDTDVGNKMVKSGVRLVSRLGSSECGCESRYITPDRLLRFSSAQLAPRLSYGARLGMASERLPVCRCAGL